MNQNDTSKIAEEEELETEVYLPFKEASQKADEGCSILYEVVHKRKKKVSTPLLESVDQDDDDNDRVSRRRCGKCGGKG